MGPQSHRKSLPCRHWALSHSRLWHRGTHTDQLRRARTRAWGPCQLPRHPTILLFKCTVCLARVIDIAFSGDEYRAQNIYQLWHKIGCYLSELNSISCLLVFSMLGKAGSAPPLPGLQVRIGREEEAGTGKPGCRGGCATDILLRDKGIVGSSVPFHSELDSPKHPDGSGEPLCSGNFLCS